MSLLIDTDLTMDKLAVIIISVFCSVHFCQASDTLYLQGGDFSVVKDDYIELYIQIKSPNAIEIISTTPDLTISFKVGKKVLQLSFVNFRKATRQSGRNAQRYFAIGENAA